MPIFTSAELAGQWRTQRSFSASPRTSATVPSTTIAMPTGKRSKGQRRDDRPVKKKRWNKGEKAVARVQRAMTHPVDQPRANPRPRPRAPEHNPLRPKVNDGGGGARFAARSKIVPCKGAGTLEGAFEDKAVEILNGSDAAAWACLHSSRARVVGVDTEGTNYEPPLLVQVAFADRHGRPKVLLEAPASGALSQNMRRLLGDGAVVKAFCGAGGDLAALGGAVRNHADVQTMAGAALGLPSGGGGCALGLAAIFGKFCGGGGEKFKKCKDGWKHFAALTRRPPSAWPFAGGDEPPAKLAALREYAAADAWATLRIYEVISQRPKSSGKARKAPRP